MNRTSMSKLMDKILEEVTIMRDAGQKEYSHNTDDVFANFNRVSNLLEVDRKKVLMTYMLKHIDGIAAYVKGHKSQREDVTGRITDCMVYLMLLWGMIEDEDGTIPGKESNASVHNVLEKIQHESGDLSLGGGRSTSYRVHSNGNLQEVRQKGSGLKESQEMGTT